VIIGGLMIVYPIWRIAQTWKTRNNLLFILICVVLSQPFFSLVDRGNIQLLVTGFVVLGMYFLESRKVYVSPLLLGIATAMKGYPGVFLLIYIKRREWKRFFLATATVLTSTTASLAVFEGGITNNIKEMMEDILQFREGNLWLRYNSSLRAFFVSGEQASNAILESLFTTLNSHYFWIAGVTALTLLLVMFVAKLDLFNFSILCCISVTLLIEITASYVLSLFFVSYLYLENCDSKNGLRKFQLLMIAILMVPKGLPLDVTLENASPSLISILNPLVLLVLMITVYIVQFQLFFKKLKREKT
jgi:hypothetical protein